MIWLGNPKCGHTFPHILCWFLCFVCLWVYNNTVYFWVLQFYFVWKWLLGADGYKFLDKNSRGSGFSILQKKGRLWFLNHMMRALAIWIRVGNLKQIYYSSQNSNNLYTVRWTFSYIFREKFLLEFIWSIFPLIVISSIVHCDTNRLLRHKTLLWFVFSLPRFDT